MGEPMTRPRQPRSAEGSDVARKVGSTVKYGLLVKDAVYQIPYTPELKEALLHLAEKVVAVYRGADPPYITGRCHICGYAPHCLYKPQRLYEKRHPRHT